MRASDPRTGYPESDTVSIASGDGNTPQTVLDIPDTGIFVPTQIKISYAASATANTDIALFDDADGTAAGNVSDRRDRFRDVAPGEVRTVDNLDMRDFENDVLAQCENGSQDANVDVTVYGELITGLADMFGGN